jgi:uncharacterized membrane protein YdjX (TVP38/TMEM64 family)
MKLHHDYVVKVTILVIVIFLSIIYVFNSEYISQTFSSENIKLLLNKHQLLAPVFFCIIYVLHFVFPLIPKELLQPLGAHLFGPIAGIFFCLLSDQIASFILFNIGKRYGHSVIHKFIHEKEIAHLIASFKHRGHYVVWVVRALPLFPTGIACVIFGSLDIKLREFMKISFFAVLPQIIILSIVGVAVDNSKQLISIIILLLIVTWILVHFRKKIKLMILKETKIITKDILLIEKKILSFEKKLINKK